MDSCPICGTHQMVSPSGRKDSPVLIIGDYPGDIEIKKGVPMVGPIGNVLKTELAFLGIDLRRCRLTNLWLHTPNKQNECMEFGIQQAILEAKGKKAILLLGSECTKYFCDKSVRRVCGLQVISPYLSAPIIYACLNPVIAFKRGGGGVGEVRLALKKFSKALKGIL